MVRIGRTVTPGVSIGSSSRVMPSCRRSPVLVRTSANIQSASCAPVVQIFWPFTTYSSPSRSAAGAQGGEVRAGAGLRVALAPEVRAVQDARQEAARAARACRSGSAPGRCDANLAWCGGGQSHSASTSSKICRWRNVPAGAAVLDRPVGGAPAAAEQDALPGAPTPGGRAWRRGAPRRGLPPGHSERQKARTSAAKASSSIGGRSTVPVSMTSASL